ncbi:hypothetical protein [Sorangium sp. So ce176]|uniref:hypothetical protein n=1 Tax=Sorangium sp. So ce176 TaxID=3133286 RepID=UPI003F6054CE
MTEIHASRRARMVLLSLALLGCGDSEDDGKGSGDPGATSRGAGGAGGSGGDGGSGGGPAALDPRVEACLRINACDADGGTPVGLHACLGHALDERWAWATVGPGRLGLAAMQCKLAATDCAGVRACTPAAGDFAAACSERAGSDLCEGDTWVFCDDMGAPIAAMDCAAAGLSCTSELFAGCGAEPCDYATTPPACDPEDKDVLIECSAAGFLTRVHCPAAHAISAATRRATARSSGSATGGRRRRSTAGPLATPAAPRPSRAGARSLTARRDPTRGGAVIAHLGFLIASSARCRDHRRGDPPVRRHHGGAGAHPDVLSCVAAAGDIGGALR